jgi:hypothetical protein
LNPPQGTVIVKHVYHRDAPRNEGNADRRRHCVPENCVPLGW